MDVSLEGGTAAFYCLRYRPERAPEGVPSDFFIGKDLAHASALLENDSKIRRLHGKFGKTPNDCGDFDGTSPPSWWTNVIPGLCEQDSFKVKMTISHVDLVDVTCILQYETM